MKAETKIAGMRALLLISLLLQGSVVFARGVGVAEKHYEFPPHRPTAMPAFSVPAAGQSLDEGWQFDTLIADAAPEFPNLFNAYPVDLEFNHARRGFLALLHTVFCTSDGGQTWRNLDPIPPPGNSQNWPSLRGATFVTSLEVRPTSNDSIGYDSLFISTMNTDNDTGRVRLIRHFGSYILDGQNSAALIKPYWMTGIEIVDSVTAVAFSGSRHTAYYNDSLIYRTAGGGIATTSWDSVRHDFGTDWLTGETSSVGNLFYAVGARQWISRDHGKRWNDYPPIDSLGDFGVSFLDTLHGLVGGGTMVPRRGWVHRTTDGGVTWSGRTLEVNTPIRTVDLVNDTLGYAGGGDFEAASGAIFETTDGGVTWHQDILTDAEIRTISHVRINGAYIDIFAAGGFPDFRCGIWRKRVYAPEFSGAVLVAVPDTLNFDTLQQGERDTLTTVLRNIGNAPITVYGISGGNVIFAPLYEAGAHVLHFDDSLIVRVAFASSVVGINERVLAVSNNLNQRVEIYCRAQVTVQSGVSEGAVLPEGSVLSVWPNPGNQEFRIQFSLEKSVEVELKVFDLTGRLAQVLAAGSLPAGEHVRSWNADGLASGVYFVRLEQATGAITRKVLLLK